MASNALLADLDARGLIAQTTADEALARHLDNGRCVYSGFDPTADSLHIGSLVPLLALRRFQLAGHRPIALVGGATGLIGDPSFKASERSLNSAETVAGWVQSLRGQVERFLDCGQGEYGAVVVDNLEWTAGIGVLDFLRDVGKHFSVNTMIQKESVKQRLQREDSGISYTEFSYMLLQSWDFAELYRSRECTVQIGGSDQWGNITGGIDLTRRLHGAQVYGMTLPLVTKADGSKFGKTEAGTIWLDPARTSPYAFYQFWLNVADADVYRFLRYFTFLPVSEIEALERADAERHGRPEAQGVLAAEITGLVHGETGLSAARRISESLFSGRARDLSADDLLQLRQDGLPSTGFRETEVSGRPLTQVLSEWGLASGKQVKDALGRGAVIVNGEALSAGDNADAGLALARQRAIHGCWFLIRLGKKKYWLARLQD